MARQGTSSEQKQAWMRERHSSPAPAASPAAITTERHYAVPEIAAMWNLSQDAVRKIFHDEPGVLVLGNQGMAHRRPYTTLRIPESVLQRVHRRLENVYTRPPC
jgi:hypothetical protein